MDGPQIDELKELVKVSLQQAGVLGNIKAQLRAEVFKVVNKEQAGAGMPPAKLAALSTSEGQVATHLCTAPYTYGQCMPTRLPRHPYYLCLWALGRWRQTSCGSFSSTFSCTARFRSLFRRRTRRAAIPAGHSSLSASASGMILASHF